MSFDSSLPSFGEGILVIRGSQLHGGDVGFVYRGVQTPEGIRVHISQHDPSVPSVLGMTRAYDLVLNGRRAGPGRYRLEGEVAQLPGRHLRVSARRLSPLLPVTDGEEI